MPQHPVRQLRRDRLAPFEGRPDVDPAILRHPPAAARTPHTPSPTQCDTDMRPHAYHHSTAWHPPHYGDASIPLPPPPIPTTPSPVGADGLDTPAYVPEAHERAPPPCDWAEVNIQRHVYPRVAPRDGAAFAKGNQGVHGVVRALYCVGAWVYITGDPDGTEGYVKAKYLRWLRNGREFAQSPRLPPPPRPRYLERAHPASTHGPPPPRACEVYVHHAPYPGASGPHMTMVFPAAVKGSTRKHTDGQVAPGVYAMNFRRR